MKNMEIAANIERQDAKESFDRSCLQHIDRESLLIKQLTDAQATIAEKEKIIKDLIQYYTTQLEEQSKEYLIAIESGIRHRQNYVERIQQQHEHIKALEREIKEYLS